MLGIPPPNPKSICPRQNCFLLYSNYNIVLCRCGGSKNKPFCDCTHWSIKFKDGED